MEQLSHLNWIPYKLIPNESDTPLFQWLYLAEDRYTDAFFDDTIRRCRIHPYNRQPWKSVSSADFMMERATQVETLAPDAFVFHVSRCGSTLLTQLLSMQPSNIAVSEAPLIDEVLRLYRPYNPDLLKATIALIGQKRFPYENKYIVKLDSWHLPFYAQFRALYPTTPFIFLYREPVAIIHSHRDHRGMHAVPGMIEPSVFDLESTMLPDLSLDAYLVRVLLSYYNKMSAIFDLKNPFDFWVDFKVGPSAMLQFTLDLIGASLSESEKEQTQLRVQFDAKRPHEKFQELEQTIPSELPLFEELMQAYANLDARLQKTRE